MMHIHILAVCGTGTASLAGCLAAQGHRVSGSDRNFHPPMGPLLQQAGVETHQGFDPAHLDPEPDLVVIGNAIHRENPEALAVMERGIPYLSFPQAVRRFLLDGRHPVVVAGTHGKTTTTAAIASILESCGLAPGFLVGGVLNGLQRSYGIGSGAPFAVEGDEYETAFFDKVPKFLHYAPKTLVLTGVEFDHADNFSSLEHLRSVFLNLVALLPPDGCLIHNAADPFLSRLARRIPARTISYGLDSAAAVRGTDVVPTAEGMRFTLHRPDARKGIPALLSRWGRHNLENGLASNPAPTPPRRDFSRNPLPPLSAAPTRWWWPRCPKPPRSRRRSVSTGQSWPGNWPGPAPAPTSRRPGMRSPGSSRNTRNRATWCW